MIQAHIFYSGMVQGIGFRYTAQRLAADLKLAGWVRNLSDGRVEILAEGSENDVEELMRRIADHFGGYIKEKEVNFKAAQGTFKNFQIAQ